PQRALHPMLGRPGSFFLSLCDPDKQVVRATRQQGSRLEENGMATPLRGVAMAPRFDFHPPG
ncbi:MAG: hypothetical protein ACF8PG_12570, partial [Maioricimonas sp. JB045]